MGATVGNENQKGSVDVHLNIVPFIDLLSCLTAFLLVTAVWSNLARVEVKSKGVNDGTTPGIEEPINASVHVTDSAIWVGLSRVNTYDRIDRVDGDYNWTALYELLKAHKDLDYFQGRGDIEIAVDGTVHYQSLVTALDTAIAAGFNDAAVLDPQQLSARAQL